MDKIKPQIQVAQLEKSLSKSRHEVSLSSHMLLFSEIVQYALLEAKRGYNIEDRLHEMGIRVGYKILDLLCYRDKANKRDIKIRPILIFISQNCWKYLFGHNGDLLKAQQNDNEYMINDKSFLLNKFVSIPRDYSSVNCAAYAAGIVEGILCSAEFPAEVSAHTVEDLSFKKITTILIKFLPEVMEREKEIFS